MNSEAAREARAAGPWADSGVDEQGRPVRSKKWLNFEGYAREQLKMRGVVGRQMKMPW